MPKAPRDQESTTPKKRSRKTAPSNGNGNGNHAENGNGALAQSPELAGDTQVTSQMKATSKAEAVPNVDEQIRARAYELYVQRGGHGGSPEHDWLRAKQEICGQ